MPKSGPSIARERSRLASAARWSPEKLPERQRDLRAALLERSAREAIDALPPLTEEQARRIASLIYPPAVAR